MSRARTLLIVSLGVAGACSGGSSMPGAMLRGPGALAVFHGVVNHENLALRPYLAVGNERGDELRLVDLDDNEVVTSPGLVFPLAIPTAGRPMRVVSAKLNDSGDPKPDALVVIAAGSNVVELVDTWTGFPMVVAQVTLASTAEVVAVAAAAVPDVTVPTQKVAGRARIVVALAGGVLELVELTRAGNAIQATLGTPLTVAGVEITSLSQGADPRYVYAGLADAVNGVARIELPGAAAPGTAVLCQTNVPVRAVAAVTYGDWSWSATDPFGASVERVFAAPLESECGEGKAVRCGLLAIAPTATTLALDASWVPVAKAVAGDEPYRIPLPLPAPILGMVAVGRPSTSQLPIVPGADASTTGLLAISAADGGVYLVDAARWKVASSASPLTGDGRTGVASASSDEVAGSRLGLWGLDGAAPSAESAQLVSRVQVVPGFTPDDTWTLTWQGILPGLDTRGAVLGRDATGPWLAVQVDVGGGVVAGVAELAALGVQAGDLVTIAGVSSVCPSGTVAEVASLDLLLTTGGAARLRGVGGGAAPTCLGTVPTTGTVGEVATFRAGGLVLTGARHGHAGRPVASSVAADRLPVFGRRVFYVTDPCTSTDCANTWGGSGLTFPFPFLTAVDPISGLTLPVSLGLAAGFVDEAGVATDTPPTNAGTALRFTTRSGFAATARRPLVDGVGVASTLPTGLAILDRDGTGAASVHASYTAGLLMLFNTAEATDRLVVIR